MTILGILQWVLPAEKIQELFLNDNVKSGIFSYIRNVGNNLVSMKYGVIHGKSLNAGNSTSGYLSLYIY